MASPHEWIRRGVPLGSGLDHDAYLVDDRLVVRRVKHGDPAEVEREARLLEVLAEFSPLPVPRPVSVDANEGWLAYERLDGVPLIEVEPQTRAAHAKRLGTELGSLVRVLQDVEAGFAERDAAPPAELLAEARENYEAVSAVMPSAHRPAIEGFLDAEPPPPAAALAFCHNDLGIEHVLVSPATMEITGIIDWSDAALADPAYDIGLILRDLGPTALDAAMPERDDALRTRAVFHGRCALLEDLAFGIARDRQAYVDKSITALAWMFAASVL